MELARRNDLVTGICLTAFGLYVTAASSRLAYVSEYGPGPGFLPLWLGVGVIGLSLYLIISSLARRSLTTTVKSEPSVNPARALSGWAALMCAILLLPWIGFALSLALLTAFLILALDRRTAWTAISIGLGLALGFHLVFVAALRVSLPAGLWGF
jgi:putative tricarboxylic transport membrane protein